MYKMHTPACPEKLKELSPPAQTRRRNTRLNSLIQQHAVETKRTKGALLWNDLPSIVVGIVDLWPTRIQETSE